MIIYLLALAMGFVAGLRALLVPAAVSWAAYAGVLDLEGTRLAFLGRPWTPWIMSSLAAFELFTDQLPSTPSRTVPFQFGVRLVTGGFAGAAIALDGGGYGGNYGGSWLAGAALGAVGAVAGTLGGHALRARLAERFGRDRPAALLEDAVAILGAVAIVAGLS